MQRAKIHFVRTGERGLRDVQNLWWGGGSSNSMSKSNSVRNICNLRRSPAANVHYEQLLKLDLSFCIPTP